MHSLKWSNSPREKKAAQIGLTTQDRRNQVEKKKERFSLQISKKKKEDWFYPHWDETGN